MSDRLEQIRALMNAEVRLPPSPDDVAWLLAELDAARSAQTRPEECICAAIRLPNGEVWRGHRHDSAITTAMQAPDMIKEAIYKAEQGFITSRNRFVGREEGARLQRAAGILSASTLKAVGDTLFSEDLYLRDWRSAPSSTPGSAEP